MTVYQRFKNRWKIIINESSEILLQLYKESEPCTDCGKYYPHYMMEFDHILERGPKLFCICACQVFFCGAKTTQKEVEKCDLVCANCHRKRTWERRQDEV
jgi:hypothetical protein